MKPLKYGINKVPGSGTIDVMRTPSSPTGRTLKIRLPERPAISDILKKSEEENIDQLPSPIAAELSPNKISVLRSMAATPGLLQESQPEETPKAKQFKRLDDVRNQIMEKQKTLDDMLDYAVQNHPGIAEDMKNRTTNYIQDYLNMFPEHDQIEQELIDLQDQYQNDPLHDEHFENVLSKIRKSKI